jgi:hypothetical protein
MGVRGDKIPRANDKRNTQTTASARLKGSTKEIEDYRHRKSTPHINKQLSTTAERMTNPTPNERVNAVLRCIHRPNNLMLKLYAGDIRKKDLDIQLN